jgi:hypothetical protein
VDPVLAEIIGLACAAIWDMDRWMRNHVRGFRGLTLDERRSYANELGLRIYDHACTCGLEHCRARHDIASQPGSEVGRPLFVRQAVIGPMDFLANSIDQGMLYRLILRFEHDMLVGKVELKRCANSSCPTPQRLYEEERCPGDRCDSVFTPEATEVIAQRWLFIQGTYVPVRRWRCRGGTHYFRQHLCSEDMVQTFPEARYHAVHDRNGGHDFCPWHGCTKDRRHPQNGTTLWVYRGLVKQVPPLPVLPLELVMLEEALQRWLPSLNSPARARLQAAAAAANIALDDDPRDVIDWLLHGENTVLLDAQRQALRDMIRCVRDELGAEEDGPRK